MPTLVYMCTLTVAFPIGYSLHSQDVVVLCDHSVVLTWVPLTGDQLGLHTHRHTHREEGCEVGPMCVCEHGKSVVCVCVCVCVCVWCVCVCCVCVNTVYVCTCVDYSLPDCVGRRQRLEVNYK